MILQGLSPHWKLSHSVVWLPVRVFVCSSVRECLKDGGAQMLMPGDEVWRREGLMSLWSLFSALKISEVGRPYLHLCKLDRVFVALPVEPVDPLWKKQQQTPPNNTNHQLFLNWTSSSEQGASFTGKNLIFSLDNSTAYGSCYGLPLHFLRCVWKRSYLTVTFVAIFPHEVDTVTVFIPKGAFVGQGAVGHSDIVIIVVSGEGPTLVVGHGVTWWTNEYYSVKAVWWA